MRLTSLMAIIYEYLFLLLEIINRYHDIFDQKVAKLDTFNSNYLHLVNIILNNIMVNQTYVYCDKYLKE